MSKRVIFWIYAILFVFLGGAYASIWWICILWGDWKFLRNSGPMGISQLGPLFCVTTVIMIIVLPWAFLFEKS